MTAKYRVDIFKDNNWLIYSRHKNEDYAIINAEIQAKKHSTRIVHNGQIIWIKELT
jgi:hypothetical protein